MRSLIRQWRDDRRGTILVQSAVVVPVLLLLVGGVIDYGLVAGQRERLQHATDAAALAAAKEFGLSDARYENVQSIVDAVVRTALAANRGSDTSTAVTATTSSDPMEVRVVARQRTRPAFGQMFGLAPSEIEVAAVARIVGRPNICVLGLDPSAGGTVALDKGARVTAMNCAVFSNSKHQGAIRSKASAVLSASMICSAGGSDGGRGNFTPSPLTDCPTFDDPLAGRPEPQVAPCDSNLPTRIEASQRLFPGTYCGGLLVRDGATVEMTPGIYVIKDGELRVKDGATLIGAEVGIFLTGKGAEIDFERKSTVDLSAPTSGPMAGILLFEARNQPTSAQHNIFSDNARKLLGTLYLSRGRLHIDANNPVADQSAYTAIVARMLTLDGGPNLVLNTNYEMTNVPVPAGIRGAAQPVALVR